MSLRVLPMNDTTSDPHRPASDSSRQTRRFLPLGSSLPHTIAEGPEFGEGRNHETSGDGRAQQVVAVRENVVGRRSSQGLHSTNRRGSWALILVKSSNGVAGSASSSSLIDRCISQLANGLSFDKCRLARSSLLSWPRLEAFSSAVHLVSVPLTRALG